MEELKEILDRLRQPSDVIDVDDLLLDVQRGKQLIDYCDNKIKRANLQIHDILNQIEETGEGARRPDPYDGNEPNEDEWRDSPNADAPRANEDIPF